MFELSFLFPPAFSLHGGQDRVGPVRHRIPLLVQCPPKVGAARPPEHSSLSLLRVPPPEKRAGRKSCLCVCVCEYNNCSLSLSLLGSVCQGVSSPLCTLHHNPLLYRGKPKKIREIPQKGGFGPEKYANFYG